MSEFSRVVGPDTFELSGLTVAEKPAVNIAEYSFDLGQAFGHG